MMQRLTRFGLVVSIPNVRVNGRIAKTNLASNTAFRGFGGPQGMMIAEQYITHVAEYLGKSVEEVRRTNLYKTDELTPFRQPLTDVFLERVWDELLESSDFVYVAYRTPTLSVHLETDSLHFPGDGKKRLASGTKNTNIESEALL